MTPKWLPELRRRLGDQVVTDPDVAASYTVDWTRRFRAEPACVIRPRTVDQVIEILRMSAEEGFGVVPQGGNTGLVGGTAAPSDTVLVNLGGLDRVVDLGSEGVVAGAGTPVAAAQEHARRRGRVFGLDMASRHSATVGGALATNAGGLYASHWGRMRDQVQGVEAVLADGSVLDTTGSRTFSGVDPVVVLAGSEGSLGVITSLRLRFHPPLGATVVALAGFTEVDAIVDFLAAAPPLVAAEVFTRAGTEIVLAHSGLSDPMAATAWYLLVEVEEHHAAGLPLPGGAIVGRDLWAYRDRITESLSGLGVVHKFDIVVPLPVLADLVGALEGELRPHRLFVFGHALMSDFHLNVAPPAPDRTVDGSVDEVVYSAVEALGGSVAGEHGVGRVKRDRYRAGLSPGHLHLVQSVKRALDPDGRLNPGVG